MKKNSLSNGFGIMQNVIFSPKNLREWNVCLIFKPSAVWFFQWHIPQVRLCSAYMLSCELFLGSLCLEGMNPMKCGCLDLAQECLRFTTSHGVLPTLSKFPRPSKQSPCVRLSASTLGRRLARVFLNTDVDGSCEMPYTPRHPRISLYMMMYFWYFILRRMFLQLDIVNQVR